jgi:hypothetical protein
MAEPVLPPQLDYGPRPAGEGRLRFFWLTAAAACAALAAAAGLLYGRRGVLGSFVLSLLTLHLAFWALVIAFGVWLYRRIKLRTLPWLGAYCVLALALGLLMPFWHRSLFNPHSRPPFGWTVGEFSVHFGYWAALLNALSDLLVAALVLCDVAFLASLLPGDAQSRPLRMLLRLRENTTALGVTLLAVQLAHPLTALIIWRLT